MLGFIGKTCPMTYDSLLIKCSNFVTHLCQPFFFCTVVAGVVLKEQLNWNRNDWVCGCSDEGIVDDYQLWD